MTGSGVLKPIFLKFFLLCLILSPKPKGDFGDPTLLGLSNGIGIGYLGESKFCSTWNSY